MNKLHYDDPLKAAYMAREFGVKYYDVNEPFNETDGHCFGKHCSDHPLNPRTDLGNFTVARYYAIHPDSYSIFEPREGDLVSSEAFDDYRFLNEWSRGTGFFVAYGDEILCRPDEVDTIILRDNKHFFMPKQEKSNASKDSK